MAQHIEFANVILRFGEEKVLIDYAESIVLPALTDIRLRRQYKDTSFFFHGAELIELTQGDGLLMGVAGRLIKDTIVHRDQLYDAKAGQLVHNPQSMPSAPSSIFLLILNNHKLVYLHETRDAPPLTAFKGTLQAFVSKKRDQLVEAEYEKHKKLALSEGAATRPKKRDFEELHPRPDLEVVPLPSEASLAEFIERYAILKSVKVELLSTNAEIDNNPLFRNMRESKKEIGAQKSTLVHQNTKDGLNKEKALQQLRAAASEGNSRFQLSGEDTLGDTLKGDTESLRIRVPVESVPESIREAAKSMYAIYKKLTENGTIRLAAVEQRVREGADSLIERLRRSNGGV